MSVYRAKKIQLELDYVLHRLNMTRMQYERNKRLAEALRQGLEEVEQLARPAFFYKEKAIAEISPGAVILEGSYRLESELLSEKLSEAHSVVAGIATIGEAVEKRTREIKKQNGLTYAFALDSLALVALDLASRDFLLNMEVDLKEKGSYLGVPLSPGESAVWDIRDQRTIYSMVDDEVTGVSITDTALLLPRNSGSFVVGLYDHPVRKEGETNCTYCSMKERCLYRKSAQ